MTVNIQKICLHCNKEFNSGKLTVCPYCQGEIRDKECSECEYYRNLTPYSGKCQRRAITHKGFPAIDANNLCGEFVLSMRGWP